MQRLELVEEPQRQQRHVPRVRRLVTALLRELEHRLERRVRLAFGRRGGPRHRARLGPALHAVERAPFEHHPRERLRQAELPDALRRPRRVVRHAVMPHRERGRAASRRATRRRSATAYDACGLPSSGRPTLPGLTNQCAPTRRANGTCEWPQTIRSAFAFRASRRRRDFGVSGVRCSLFDSGLPCVRSTRQPATFSRSSLGSEARCSRLSGERLSSAHLNAYRFSGSLSFARGGRSAGGPSDRNSPRC